MTKFNMTRRNALAGIGASATALASGITIAATPEIPPLLHLHDVPLAWPLYQRMASFDVPPAIGDSVTLERGAQAFSTDAVVVRDLLGIRLGTVSRKDAPAVAWAMDRGGRVEAKIAQIDMPMNDKGVIPGWGHIRLSIRVEKREGAFV